jgi:hypothetical protein
LLLPAAEVFFEALRKSYAASQSFSAQQKKFKRKTEDIMDRGLTIVTQQTLTMKTAQEKVYEFSNTTGNDAPFKRTLTTKRSFDASSTMERLREQTRTDKYKIESSVSFDYGTESGNAKASADFENVVHDYLKTSTDTKNHYDQETSTSLELSLKPKDAITIYNNATFGEGYKYEYETNVPLTPAVQQTQITITITTDLNPIFNSLLDTVTSNANGISTDSGEWGAYSAICSDARVDGGIAKYIQRVKNELWTDGLDRDSWSAVKDGAAHADIALSQGKKQEALEYILLAFNNVRNPSHNSWAWDNCRNVGINWLRN